MFFTRNYYPTLKETFLSKSNFRGGSWFFMFAQKMTFLSAERDKPLLRSTVKHFFTFCRVCSKCVVKINQLKHNNTITIPRNLNFHLSRVGWWHQSRKLSLAFNTAVLFSVYVEVLHLFRDYFFTVQIHDAILLQLLSAFQQG